MKNQGRAWREALLDVHRAIAAHAMEQQPSKFPHVHYITKRTLIVIDLIVIDLISFNAQVRSRSYLRREEHSPLRERYCRDRRSKSGSWGNSKADIFFPELAASFAEPSHLDWLLFPCASQTSADRNRTLPAMPHHSPPHSCICKTIEGRRPREPHHLQTEARQHGLSIAPIVNPWLPVLEPA